MSKYPIKIKIYIDDQEQDYKENRYLKEILSSTRESRSKYKSIILSLSSRVEKLLEEGNQMGLSHVFDPGIFDLKGNPILEEDELTKEEYLYIKAIQLSGYFTEDDGDIVEEVEYYLPCD